MDTNMGKLLVYTRIPESCLYHGALAYSVHFAYSDAGITFEPLHQNYGMLFAPGEISKDNTIEEKGLVKPYLYRLPQGGYGIEAIRTDVNGKPEPVHLLWTSPDLRIFTFHGPVPAGNAKESVLGATERLDTIPLPDIVPGNMLDVDRAFGRELLRYWSPLHNISISVPESITARCVEDIQKAEAVAVYTDGSTWHKKVEWDMASIHFDKPGDYPLTGTVMQPEFQFPLTLGHGDPVVFPWQGWYYYIATNDNTDDRGFFVRRAMRCAELFSGQYEEQVILDVSERFVQTFWAPEFHVIGEDLYLLFAVSGKVWGPQCHMMKLKRGGEILHAADWEEPVLVCRKDGSPLASNAITLDMTCFHAKGQTYVVWSYRENIGNAADSGSMLYIATIDPSCPYRLASEPVLLSRPLLGWENMDRTINNEGPYALIANQKVYLTYSGAAADGYSYVLGLLTADLDDDLLDSACWSKWPTAVLSYLSIPFEYGPGHNSFFRDEDGNIMIAYHAKQNELRSARCAAIHRVHFGIDGKPVFDLSAERDLDPKLRRVQSIVHVL